MVWLTVVWLERAKQYREEPLRFFYLVPFPSIFNIQNCNNPASRKIDKNCHIFAHRRWEMLLKGYRKAAGKRLMFLE
jgi:hypothetical protein